MLLLLSWLVAAGCGQVWSIGCGSKEVEGSTLGRAEGELLHKRQKIAFAKNQVQQTVQNLDLSLVTFNICMARAAIAKNAYTTHLLNTSWFLKTGSVGEIQRTPKTEHGVESCLLHRPFLACNLVWVSCGCWKKIRVCLLVTASLWI